MVSVSEEKDGLFPGEEFRSSFWARTWCKSVVSDNGSMVTGEEDVKIMDEKKRDRWRGGKEKRQATTGGGNQALLKRVCAPVIRIAANQDASLPRLAR